MSTDYKIFNTAFNQLAFQTSLGNKTVFVTDVLWKYKGPTNSFYNIYEPYLYDSNIELNSTLIGNYYLINNAIKFFFDLSANRTLIWGDDSPEFVAALIDIFNLSNLSTGTTNVIEFNFSFDKSGGGTLPYNVYLGNISGTTDYVAFNGSSTSILFDTALTAGSPITVTLTITDFTPGSETCTFTWTP